MGAVLARLLGSRKVRGAILGGASSLASFVGLLLLAKFNELRKLAMDSAQTIPLVVGGLFGAQVLGQGMADVGTEAQAVKGVVEREKQASSTTPVIAPPNQICLRAA